MAALRFSVCRITRSISFPVLAPHCLLEFFEQGDLCGVDDLSGVGEGEPSSLVDLGKGLLLTLTARPFQFECIADNFFGIEIAWRGPGKDTLAAFLADGT